MKSPRESAYSKKRNGSPHVKAGRRPKPEVSQFVHNESISNEMHTPCSFLKSIIHMKSFNLRDVCMHTIKHSKNECLLLVGLVLEDDILNNFTSNLKTSTSNSTCLHFSCLTGDGLLYHDLAFYCLPAHIFI